jgi:hypothetical protein
MQDSATVTEKRLLSLPLSLLSLNLFHLSEPEADPREENLPILVCILSRIGNIARFQVQTFA